MYLRTSILALVLGLLPYGTTSWTGLLGLPYPIPRDDSSNSSAISAAWINFTSVIEASLTPKSDAEDNFPGLANYTFSVGAFSPKDPGVATMQYHHTGEDVEKSAVGANAVDGHSVYRTASVSKMFTAYLLLVELGSGYWARPVSEFVPNLTSTVNVSSNDPLQMVEWNKVTLGSLAANMAGIFRDAAPYNGDLLQLLSQKDLVAAGLPPLDTSILPSCARRKDFACPATEYISSIKDHAPVFLPWESPAYSNAGFTLLGLAIENITSRSLSSLFHDNIFEPLQMTSTSYTVPTQFSHAVVPGGSTNVSFGIDYGNASASGGIYSTTNDLSKLGIAILNSTLLPPKQTREWLKPVSHTADLHFSVGRPWEILRLPQGADGRIVDFYTKAGDLPQYSGYLILSPDYDYGFSVLTASTSGSVPFANAFIADTLASTMIPALESQAVMETAANFGGHYKSDEASLNSSISLAVRPSSGPALLIESWISNGTDVLSQLPALFGVSDIRLFASIGDRQGGKVAFRAIGGPSDARDLGPFSRQLVENVGWQSIGSVEYGGNSLDLFIFDEDKDGGALSVTPALTRATLKRVC